MYHRKNASVGENLKNEAVDIVNYFAEESHRTMEDASKEFNCSKDTLRRRMKYLNYLISNGEFSNNSEFEKKMKLAYCKARKNLDSHKIRTAKNYCFPSAELKSRLKNDLLKKNNS